MQEFKVAPQDTVFKYKFKKSPLDNASCDKLFSEETEHVTMGAEGKHFIVTSSLDVLDIRKKYPDWDIKIYLNNNTLLKSSEGSTVDLEEDQDPEEEEGINGD